MEFDKINPIFLPEIEMETKKILYDNTAGTNANFTLSDNYTDFDYIEVYLKNGLHGRFAPEITNSIVLSQITNSDTLYYASVGVAFSGTNVTLSNNKSWYGSNTTQNTNRVCRVVGIKNTN